MTSTRIEFRLDEKLKAKVEKASALSGAKSVTEYVLKIMDEHATSVIAQHESMVVKEDIFDYFVDACEKAGKPNKALRDAAAYTKKQGIR